MGVKLQPQQQSKSRPQRRREQSGTSGCANERKRLYVHSVRPRGRTLTDHDVQLVVFEGRVKNLFQRGLQAMHFIDKKHLPVAQVRQDRSQVTLDLKRRTRSLLKSGTELVGDNVSERSLAQPRRSVEQYMVKRLAARFGRLDSDIQILFDLILADELLQPLRPKLQLKRGIIFDRSGRNEAVFNINIQRGIVFCGGHSRRY